MLSHQLGQNVVLRLDFLLQVGDPFLLGGMVRPRFLLESSSPVLEEFLLPAVEDRRLESHFIAQLRDGLLFQQMPPHVLVQREMESWRSLLASIAISRGRPSLDDTAP